MTRSTAPSPTQDVEYAAAKTPDGLDHRTHTPDRPSAKLGGLGQLVIFTSIFVFTFAQFFYFSTSYESLSSKIGAWFGVTEDGEGHSEMVIPMYFFLFTVLPVAASVLVFELLRHYNVHRITSSYAIKVTSVLRLKPHIGSWISSWSWGEILFAAVLLGGNVNVFYYYFNACVIYYRDSDLELNFSAYLDCCGLGMGYASMFNMAFLFLPSTRNSTWMEFLGISYANGIKFHRWVGVLTIVTALLHTIFYYWMYIRMDMWSMMSLPCFHCDAGDDGKSGWMNFLGLIALIAMLLIAATSIPYVRRRMYGVFYSVHHLFIVAVVFSVLHYNSIIMAILPTFVLYLISRTISSSNGSTPVAVKEFAVLGTDIVKIVIRCAVNGTDTFQLGQFVYLNIPAISKLQWHPFTIASSPHTKPDSITILLKVHGNWTTQLAKYADTCKESGMLPVVFMDGYYGASLELYDKYSTVILVGGGTGVTPLLAILETMVAKLAEGDAPKQKAVFIFTFRELALLEEIHPLLMRIKELDPQGNYFSTRLSVTQQPTNEQLETLINQDLLKGESPAIASSYDKSVCQTIPLPFSAPVRSSLSKAVLYLTAFIIVCVTLTALKYGQKIQANNANLWPLQNFAEITLLFLIVPLVTIVFVLVDRKRHSPLPASSSTTASTANWHVLSDVHTFQDLVSEHGVEMGPRPDMRIELATVLDEHKQRSATHATSSNNPLGVFVSGPKTLKEATIHAITEQGATNFDVLEEEFEL
jgi:ferric-chelate reductase